jgi:hypothetical protein
MAQKQATGSHQNNSEQNAHYLLTITTGTFQYIAGYYKEWQL